MKTQSPPTQPTPDCFPGHEGTTFSEKLVDQSSEVFFNMNRSLRRPTNTCLTSVVVPSRKLGFLSIHFRPGAFTVLYKWSTIVEHSTSRWLNCYWSTNWLMISTILMFAIDFPLHKSHTGNYFASQTFPTFGFCGQLFFFFSSYNSGTIIRNHLFLC